jgi:hypothetical protein
LARRKKTILSQLAIIKDSHYRSGRSPHWIKSENPACAAVKREAEEDWRR